MLLGHYISVPLDFASALNTVDLSFLGFSWSVLQKASLDLRPFDVCYQEYSFPCTVQLPKILRPFCFCYLMPLGRLICGFKNVSYHFYTYSLVQLFNFLSCIKHGLASNYLQTNLNKTEALIITSKKKIVWPCVKTSLRNHRAVLHHSFGI